MIRKIEAAERLLRQTKVNLSRVEDRDALATLDSAMVVLDTVRHSIAKELKGTSPPTKH